MKSYDIINCKIIRNGNAEQNTTVRVRNGVVASIEPDAVEWVNLSGEDAAPIKKAPTGRDGAAEIFDARGNWTVPGFVELHIHGCGDLSLEQEEAGGRMLHRTCLALEKYGINTFLPTLQANVAAITRLGKELDNSSALKQRIPGLYVEGPFVEIDKRGGILEEHIEVPDIDRLKRLQELARGTIKLMTFAPELPGARKLLKVMDQLGIMPCFGHSNSAAAEALGMTEMRQAEGKVPVHLTHLFNAMSPLSHKDPGLAMLPFLSDTVSFELNGDGIHINPDMLKLCWRHLNRKKMVLISDAVVSAGKPPGEYAYFGKEVVSGGQGVRYKENGVLIGSNLLIPQIASVFADIVEADIPDILPLITENPHAVLAGPVPKRPFPGEMREGAEADLLVIGEQFQCVRNFNKYSSTVV